MFFESIDRDSLLKPGWEDDAPTVLGIKLHPSGEYNGIDYMMQLNGDQEKIRMMFKSLSTQVLFNCIAIFLLFRSLRISMRMIYKRPHILAGWCCAIQAVVGLIFVITCVSTTLPHGPTCREILWVGGICLTISPWCVGAVLLQKAYLVHSRNRLLLVIGIILLLPQIYVGYALWTGPVIMEPSVGCLSLYPEHLPIVKILVDAPINVVFSIAFIVVVYQQYKEFGSEAWGRLTREGIQTMCMVVAANLLCMLCAAFEVFGVFSELLFILDCITTSVLLVRHCSTMLNRTSKYRRI
jgi:hypothetical protein